ncbi:hypothetical protein [Mucilaginibacter rubeus]|uniref:Uncharacterized protein n=1 Tax=Mucilaginibacter rubeus TaxID=2027860 RepID=A0A5C1I5B1_9SPHI|nr:hypothetical protein [Mucilaginibacter rubeus]QEM13024.1 hypothetical protein DEO27_024440 [Mucilaginibacter rubeus]
MSYITYNLIAKIENNRDALIEALTKNLRYQYVHEFFTPFHGVVCQTNDNLREIPFTRFTEENFNNEADKIYKVENQLRDYSIELSKSFADTEIAFINVDCFGGKCSSNGFVVKNGQKIYENDGHHSAHMDVLKKISADYSGWHFHPFTRNFYSRKAGVKGGIVGDIVNFTLPAIWMSFDIEFGKNPAYRIVIAKNELLVEKANFFEFYFMKIDDNWLKVLGTIFDDSAENLADMENTMSENLSGLEYQVQFDLFDGSFQKKIGTLPVERGFEVAQQSYRYKAFNERPFQFQPPGNNSQQTGLKQDENAGGFSNDKKGFFSRLFRRK